MAAEAEIGVFGGSGFYSFLDDVEEVELDTPYGKPRCPSTRGRPHARLEIAHDRRRDDWTVKGKVSHRSTVSRALIARMS